MLITGDISWAMRVEDAAVDLQWIDRLPGTKVMIRGNHDYWSSLLIKSPREVPSAFCPFDPKQCLSMEWEQLMPELECGILLNIALILI